MWSRLPRGGDRPEAPLPSTILLPAAPVHLPAAPVPAAPSSSTILLTLHPQSYGIPCYLQSVGSWTTRFPGCSELCGGGGKNEQAVERVNEVRGNEFQRVRDIEWQRTSDVMFQRVFSSTGTAASCPSAHGNRFSGVYPYHMVFSHSRTPRSANKEVSFCCLALYG